MLAQNWNFLRLRWQDFNFALKYETLKIHPYNHNYKNINNENVKTTKEKTLRL